jgi:hypothetical protein
MSPTENWCQFNLLRVGPFGVRYCKTAQNHDERRIAAVQAASPAPASCESAKRRDRRERHLTHLAKLLNRHGSSASP